MKKLSMLCALILSLVACGGGGGTAGGCIGSTAVCFPSVNTTPAASLPPLTLPPGPSSAPIETLANVCTPSAEKTWVRAHLDDVYLWYREIVNVFPTSYADAREYFDALLVRTHDRFSFTAVQAEIDKYFESGEEIGYGISLVNENGRLRVTLTQPNSPAAQQNIVRGTDIVGINGVAIGLLSRNEQIAALYPTKAGQSNSFDVLDPGASAPRSVQLSATAITRSPVPKSTVITSSDNKKIGYLVFTDHISTAEDALANTIGEFKRQGIDDLVLDVRYNGGGYLYIASELASMIAGSAVKNQIFEKLQYNDKHADQTNDPNYSFGFFNTKMDSTPLPQLNLRRVFVLTGPGTCSASESIINSLAPFMRVVTIGGVTCGKPYGMQQANNCGTAYFAIRFQGVNSLGQGDYTDGFVPNCAAGDDLNHALGDPAERLLSIALAYRVEGACPMLGISRPLSGQSVPGAGLEIYRAPWRENRIIK